MDMNESLGHLDLKNNVGDIISIDEYEPKSGQLGEVVVIAFSCDDDSPANDLMDFISTSDKNFIDVEVSPNPDIEGNFLVFCEIPRDKDFAEHFKAIVYDVQRVSDERDWQIRLNNNEKVYELEGGGWEKKVRLRIPDSNEEITETFFKNTLLHRVDLINESLFLHDGYHRYQLSVIDCGEHNDMMTKYNKLLQEHAMSFFTTHEYKNLENTLSSSMSMMPVGQYIFFDKGDYVLVAKDLQYV